jgi:hypothetical protein
MDVSSLSGAATGQAYAVGVMKIAQNAAKAQGEAAVALIEGATQAAPPVGANGEGSLINTYG